MPSPRRRDPRVLRAQQQGGPGLRRKLRQAAQKAVVTIRRTGGGKPSGSQTLVTTPITNAPRRLAVRVPSARRGNPALSRSPSPGRIYAPRPSQEPTPRTLSQSIQNIELSARLRPRRDHAEREGGGCRTNGLPSRRSTAMGRHHQPFGGLRRNAISDYPHILRDFLVTAPLCVCAMAELAQPSRAESALSFFNLSALSMLVLNWEISPRTISWAFGGAGAWPP